MISWELSNNAGLARKTNITLKLMERVKCPALTRLGVPCKSKVPEGQELCWIHRAPQCSVCLGHMTATGNRTLPCNHTFHSRCVDRWKRSRQGDPTCPMCRAPFDLPKYRCRLIVEQVAPEGQPSVVDFITNNVSSIVDGFGLDFRNIGQRMATEIFFDIEQHENLRDVLTQLGLPVVPGFD